MQVYDFNVTTTQPQSIGVQGRYLKYLSGNAGGGDATLYVQGGRNGEKAILAPGQALTWPKSWNDFTLSNYAGLATITGKVLIGDGRMDDSTLQGVVSTVDGGKARTLNNQAFALVLSPIGSAGNYAVGQLWNPAGSGVRLVVEAIGINSNVANSIAFWSRATAQQTTLVGAGNSKSMTAGNTSVGLGYVGGSATVTPDPTRLACQAILQWGFVQQKLAEPIIVPPGAGLNCLNATAQNQVLGVQFEWYEEANV